MVLFLARQPHVWEQSLASSMLTNAMSAGLLSVSWDTLNWGLDNGLYHYDSGGTFAGALSASLGGRVVAYHSSDKNLKPRAHGASLSADEIDRHKASARVRLNQSGVTLDKVMGPAAVYPADGRWSV